MVRYDPVERAVLDAFLTRVLDDQHFTSGDDVADVRRRMADAQRALDDRERQVKNIGDSLVQFAAHPSLMADFQTRLMTASIERDAAVAVMDELREQLEKASGKVSRAEHIRRVGDIRADLRSSDKERAEQAGRLIKMAMNDVVDHINIDVQKERISVGLVRDMGFALGPLTGPLSFLDTVKNWKDSEHYAEGDKAIERYLDRRQSA